MKRVILALVLAIGAVGLRPVEAADPRVGGMCVWWDEQGIARVLQTECPASLRDPKTGWLVGARGDQVPRSTQQALGDLVRVAAERHAVDPRLIHSVIIAESGGNPQAVSTKGARGLMQLMPRTAAGLGVWNSFDPRQNIEGGTRYLRSLLDRFGGDLALALAGYNAGPGAVETYRGVPPYDETRGYVRKVLALYRGSGELREFTAKIPAEFVRTARRTVEVTYWRVRGGRMEYSSTPFRR